MICLGYFIKCFIIFVKGINFFWYNLLFLMRVYVIEKIYNIEKVYNVVFSVICL